MTNAELIAMIKAEIERRKSLLTQHSKLTYDLILEVFIKEYDDLLSFLSTLESEKLKENANKYIVDLTPTYPDAPVNIIVGGMCWEHLRKAMEEEL